MARPELRALGTAVEAEAKEATVKTPASTTIGDGLILHTMMDVNTQTVTTPAGWTILGESTTSVAETMRSVWFWRVATEAGEKSITVTFSTINFKGLQITAIKNVDQTTPFPVCEVKAAAAKTVSCKVPAATPPRAECMSLISIALDSLATGTPPINWTEQQDNNGKGIYLCTRENIAKEATGEQTVTQSAEHTYIGAQIIAQPAIEEPPASVVQLTTAPPPQLSVVAIAEGGQGRGFDLSDEIDGLNWSNVNPGGDEVCSFTVSRSWYAENPEFEKGNLLRVIAGVDVLWQGRVEEIDRSTGDSESLAVTCYGSGNRLGDTTFREIYIDPDLSKWGEMSIQRRIDLIAATYVLSVSASVGFQEAGATAAGIVFDFSGIEKIAGLRPGTELYYSAGGIDLGRLIFDFLGDGTTTWDEVNGLSSDDVWTSIDKAANLNGTSATQVEVAATTSGRKFGVLQAFYTGGFVGQMNNKHVYQNVKVLGRHGLSLKGTWPLVGFSADQIASNIVSKANGVTARLISTFAYIMPRFMVDTPTTPKDALPQVNEFANADYGTWGPESPLDSSTSGYFDFTEKQSATQHWFALKSDFEEDLNFHTETTSLYDTVDISYTDEAQLSRVERFSIVSPELRSAGLSPRVFPLDAGTMTKAGAQILAESFLALFAGFAPARGSGTLSGRIRHYRRGLLPSIYLRADGSNMRIPDVLPAETTFSLDSTPDRRTTFPIKRVNVDASGDVPRVNVEFDQANDSLAMLLAQEAAQAGFIG